MFPAPLPLETTEQEQEQNALFLFQVLLKSWHNAFFAQSSGYSVFSIAMQLGQPGLQLGRSLGIPPTQAPRGSAHRPRP